jgi:hypothetical protein
LAAGLVAPFPIIATKREAWYLEYRPVREQDPALLAFRKWLRGEAEQQSQVEAEMIQWSIKAASKMARRSEARSRLPRFASHILRRGTP